MLLRSILKVYINYHISLFLTIMTSAKDDKSYYKSYSLMELPGERIWRGNRGSRVIPCDNDDDKSMRGRAEQTRNLRD